MFRLMVHISQAWFRSVQDYFPSYRKTKKVKTTTPKTEIDIEEWQQDRDHGGAEEMVTDPQGSH